MNPYNPPLYNPLNRRIGMEKLFKLVGYLFAILFISNVYAADIEVLRAWGHATVPGQDSVSIDLHVISKQNATLVGVSSPVAKSAEIHLMFDDKGVMRMREVNSVELPAGKVVDLSLINHHLMLLGLTAPLKADQTIPLTLTFKLSNNELVKVETTAHIKAEHHHHLVNDHAK
jgi:copper(I)-binding protein